MLEKTEKVFRNRLSRLQKQFERTSMVLEKYLEEDEPRRELRAPFPHVIAKGELNLLEGMVVDMSSKLLKLRRERQDKGMN
jgi:uncharacterized protein (UPF0216 family)